ncbi:MAG: GNAT family N-acetyltransferase [Desulfarculaceae bacterium]|nr:GNAT family N-acetyltransferase [Desulfarculaceae bacterium]MCF8048444.1 GNAT family N-acetyltransferase [Desulfarculaceae bacterium]MCF8066478.1 GNAT family N-acetyltransferase [Desulfarculaceae bacterium]MCF8096239.1 GNAT family N-acetyltransferase [Desulfarculaceae bacterium]MCF8123599.1 GNAT family N-acetyltransferase [Desulfarculaceae bacterium]
MEFVELSGKQAAQRPEALALAQDAPWGQGWPPGPDHRVLADRDWSWLAAWHPLAFDSEVFGLPLGQVSALLHRNPWPEASALEQGAAFMKRLATGAREAGLAGLFARAAEKDFLAAQALEAVGAKLVDASVVWEADLSGRDQAPTPPKGFVVRPATDGDATALAALAAGAFCDLEAYADRFALDPRLRHGCGELYRRWLANSLSGRQADMVLALATDEMPVGFITLRRNQGQEPGWVVLNAVSPDKRGLGLYNMLLAHGLAWLAGQGASRARVRTKFSQRAVIRAWSRLGARPLAGDFTFHLWLDEL